LDHVGREKRHGQGGGAPRGRIQGKGGKDEDGFCSAFLSLTDVRKGPTGHLGERRKGRKFLRQRKGKEKAQSPGKSR